MKAPAQMGSPLENEENPRFMAAIDGITDGFKSPTKPANGRYKEFDLNDVYRMGVCLGQTIVNQEVATPMEPNPFNWELEERQYTSSELRTLRTRQQAQYDILHALYQRCLAPEDEILNIVKSALDSITEFGDALDAQYKNAAKYGKKK